MCIYINVYVYVFVICMCVYVYIYIYIYVCIYIYTYVYIYIWRFLDMAPWHCKSANSTHFVLCAASGLSRLKSQAPDTCNLNPKP